MIIDSHTHLGEGNNRIWTPHDLLTSMDNAGVDYAIVIAESTNSGEMAKIEYILSVIQHEPRLKAVVDIDFTTFDFRQIARITHLLETHQVVGVKCYLGYEEYYAYNEKLFPLYEYCQENQVPVIYHTGALESGSYGLLKYTHPLTIDEVANHFPDMPIIMAHMGNPWILDCASVMFNNQNVFADISGYFTEYKPIKHQEIASFTTQMENARLFLGSYKKFLFGTDWPLYTHKDYLKAIEALNLTGEEKELFLWKNAKRLFKLDV